MTTTTEKKITIILSDRQPIKIGAGDWPRIAEADWFSGAHECQANEVAHIRVRQHADGRTVVYGSRDRGPGGMAIEYRGVSAGYLIEPAQGVLATERSAEEHAAAIVRAIRRVAGALGMEQLGSECIGDLPAEDL